MRRGCVLHIASVSLNISAFSYLPMVELYHPGDTRVNGARQPTNLRLPEVPHCCYTIAETCNKEKQ